MQTGRSQVGYPVEAGNSEVSALSSYPAVPGRSNVRPPVGYPTLQGNPIVGDLVKSVVSGPETGNSKVRWSMRGRAYRERLRAVIGAAEGAGSTLGLPGRRGGVQGLIGGDAL